MIIRIATDNIPPVREEMASRPRTLNVGTGSWKRSSQSRVESKVSAATNELAEPPVFAAKILIATGVAKSFI